MFLQTPSKLVLVLAALAFTAVTALLLGPSTALGQTPTATPTVAQPGTTPTPTVTVGAPAHASEFHGRVTIDGQPAPDGTDVQALVDAGVCGTTTTQNGQYSVSVKSGFGVGVDFQENCGNNGDTVAFRSGHLIADEQGQFSGGTAQTLDLTFGQAPTATPALPDTGAGTTTGVGTGDFDGLTGAVLGLGLAAVALALVARRVMR